MRSCYLTMSNPGAWLGMQLSLPTTPMPRQTHSAGSTGPSKAGRLPDCQSKEVGSQRHYSDRVLHALTHRQTCPIGYLYLWSNASSVPKHVDFEKTFSSTLISTARETDLKHGAPAASV